MRFEVMRLDNHEVIGRFNNLESARKIADLYINTFHIMVEIIENMED